MAWLLALLWAGMPLYPSFIALLPIAPPGLSLLGPLAALVLLGAVGVLTVCVAWELGRHVGPRLFADRLVQAMGVYLASMAIASMLGLVPIVGAVFCIITLCTCIGATAVRTWGSDPRVARYMTVSLLASSCAASILALVCWVTRMPALLYAIGNGRAIGSFVVPGELAGYLGMLLPYTIGVACVTRERWLRFFAYFVACIDTAAALATFSRAGIFGLVVAALLITVLVRRRIFPWLLAGSLIVASQARHLINLHHNPAENFNRFSIWHAAVRVMLLFPLWGVGPGGFSRIYRFVKLPGGEPTAFHAHSFFLTTGAETGLVGVVGLASLWVTFGLLYRTAYCTANARARILGLAILLGFVATWIQSFVDVVQVLFLGLWIPFMGMALVALEDGTT